jgi:hypothetical protein
MSYKTEVGRLVEVMIEDVALRRATYYRAPNFTLKMSRQRRNLKGDRQETFLFTYGRPNYREVRFIKKAQTAGEPFPVKKVQLQYWPTKR